MPKLTEILKEFGKYESGVNEWPAFKRFVLNDPLSNLGNLYSSRAKWQSLWPDLMDSFNMITKYALHTGNVFIIKEMFQQASSHQIGSLEATLKAGAVIGIFESLKYFLHRIDNHLKQYGTISNQT